MTVHPQQKHHHKNNSKITTLSRIVTSDVLLTVIAKFAPPVPVYMKKGFSKELAINTGLCLLGGLPGTLHSWYVICKSSIKEIKLRKQKQQQRQQQKQIDGTQNRPIEHEQIVPSSSSSTTCNCQKISAIGIYGIDEELYNCTNTNCPNFYKVNNVVHHHHHYYVSDDEQEGSIEYVSSSKIKSPSSYLFDDDCAILDEDEDYEYEQDIIEGVELNPDENVSYESGSNYIYSQPPPMVVQSSPTSSPIQTQHYYYSNNNSIHYYHNPSYEPFELVLDSTS